MLKLRPAKIIIGSTNTRVVAFHRLECQDPFRNVKGSFAMSRRLDAFFCKRFHIASKEIVN